MYMYIISCLCLTSVCATAPLPSDQHIQRINYGILFEKTSDIYLGQEYWLHTFRIPLPKKLHLQPLYCNMPQCQTAGHIIKSLNLLRMQCMASVNSTVHHIHQLVPTSELPPSRKYIGSSRDLGEGYINLVHQGNVGVYARFAEATTETICALAYCECPGLLMIDQTREVRNI